ncbi:DEAD/DEAH box helicase [Pelodictyon phaeoclathratiforme]|jgi:type III restriction enzyme|uniref:Type III restriction protein res subunit n=1 Tax=Pelodictyon phaeoclathratiforme (strain DSM 5477 / BU-1) TaxID=324925 RepID=B4SC97_PELPB|nr:DEAD/DEAH box helicase family protein [Pelodictyon phaeoclathratiforme]ACF42677.1 type III restriction protein res subunit [Pelodictyon phaeoclathratiforme BU-1]MBV5329154.1 DEAD/DEAH box helicase family protein [Chlorobium sp.]
MNRHVNSISGRLSLREPQRRSLEILDRVTEIVPPHKSSDLVAALMIIKSEFPAVTDFEREFPSLCFALATGVGKTRLMGAFISYLHLAHGLNNFFVLAPNLTIYNKLIADFTPNTSKYVFKGIAEFSIAPPAIITGDDYQQLAGNLFDQTLRCKINIFNISKINSEVRGGSLPRIKRLAEYIGQSYFDYLAALPDLVLLMDESHRYRASAGVRAINELKPVLGLELTATPFMETTKGPIPFKNVVLSYPLAKAMEDGFVKEPAVVTRKDFNSAGMPLEALEKLKLEDGIRLHEGTKVELETYARESGNRIVKPFVLVIARDTTHAGQLLALIQSADFFEGRYKEHVIQVDSSMTGEKEDVMVQRLLAVESTDEPTEIVIHVNMLKEGWDVTNLYTIVPLRAANARILIEQSIGRGLRLPYGRRTGVPAVDRLSIVAHDRFQEIVDEAQRPDSVIRLQQIILDPDELRRGAVTVVSQSNLSSQLGIKPQQVSSSTQVAPTSKVSVFSTPEEQKVAQLAYEAIRKVGSDVRVLPSISHLQDQKVLDVVSSQVDAAYQPAQYELGVVAEKLDIAAIVKKTAILVQEQSIDIPRILVAPKGEVCSGFNSFKLQLESLKYQPPEDELWIQYLRTGEHQVVGFGDEESDEVRLEDYIVNGLIDFDDVSYDDHADLLYGLAQQVVAYFKSYLEEAKVEKILRYHQKDVAHFVHAQMQEHYWEGDTDYDIEVKCGFVPLKESAYSVNGKDSALDYRQAPEDKSNMAKYLFGGFSKCLYPVQKFDSDTERQVSVILEREAAKWFRPARGQFEIYYRSSTGEQEYQPDFVAETEDAIYMLEPKARKEMEASDVLAKKAAAVQWCKNASDFAKTHGGKSWIYLLIPHDAIAVNMTLKGLLLFRD